MSYEPLPRSVPARAIAWLQTQAMAVSTSVLAASIDSDAASVAAGLVTALRHGVVQREQRDGRWYWSTGPGTSAIAADDDDAPTHRPPVPLTAWKVPTVPVFPGQVGSADAADDEPEPATHCRTCVPEIAAAIEAELVGVGNVASEEAVANDEASDEPEAARFALWSDGTFEIRRVDYLVRLTLEETGQLLEYLDGMRSAWKGREAA